MRAFTVPHDGTKHAATEISGFHYNYMIDTV